MHRHEGNVIPAGHRTACSLQLGERAYITTGCCKNAEMCFENFLKIAL